MRFPCVVDRLIRQFVVNETIGAGVMNQMLSYYELGRTADGGLMYLRGTRWTGYTSDL